MGHASRVSIPPVALAIVGIAAVACAFGLGRLSSSGDGDDSPSGLPRCADLPGVILDAGASSAGCITTDGAALQGYRFECLDSPEQLEGVNAVGPDSHVIVIPDAGLVGRSGAQWQELGRLAAYHRTPFQMLGDTACTWLRSVPADWPVRVGCDLDAVRIDLVSAQGCERDGTYYAAVGRLCAYQDGDTGAFWEQWWLDGPADTSAEPAPEIETAGPPETWTLIGDVHRDDRCRVAPNDWPEEWRVS